MWSDVEQRVTLLQHAKDLEHERFWLLIHADIGPVLLCVWYRPPCAGEIGSIHGFIEEWHELSKSCVGTIIVGDLNVHHKYWLKHSASNSVEGSVLYHFCCDNGFRQLVKKATHEDGHTLDLVMTDLVEVHKVDVLPRIADHNVIRSFANLAVPQSGVRTRRVFDFQSANWVEINRALASLDWSWISSFECDEAAVHFTECVLDVVREHVAEKTSP